ncbi:hypothetical protein SCBWM1_gp94 [Synechococcus phage S-CBWM1]|uniref:Uncharacterized protein n=1 Tax=Synechococcus phage S-CBWM1 TaxID=2053653 RepID=A0A3G1L3M5_9CAUD|nr:hypothetical protein HOU61_gp103 [Synechococcus phage S-CBWM1]ATW62778.1 hypothetical protein SCBWM1_gp94 [Synechococcus phage S-CBWM1]
MTQTTLLFPDYPTAVSAAKSLGFWEDQIIQTPIYDTEAEPDAEGNYPPLLDENGQPSFTETTEGRLKTAGQTIPEVGSPFSWMIDEIGADPVVIPGTYDEEGNEIVAPSRLLGYVVNVTGELPETALAYSIPYGSAGRLFSGSEAEPFSYEPIPDKPGYVLAKG